ncbi:MAG: hypothetical protein SPG52_00125, partial [Candidatus Cryptobacteroides sp.]|nr:hypothetical protein [Candidatus Cryptobacteroides sp.]
QAETAGKDKTITYKRIACAGQWYFHSSGVDICFESTYESYGGILIRAIKDMTSGKAICGPYNVMDTLFDKFDASGTKNSTAVEPDVWIETETFDIIIEAKRSDAELFSLWDFDNSDIMAGIIPALITKDHRHQPCYII